MIQPLSNRFTAPACLLAASLLPSAALGARTADASASSFAAPAEPAPYAPYRGEGIAPPGPASSAAYPAPLPEEPEYTRRSVEIVLDLGLGVPHCASGEDSDYRCSGVGGGLSLGLTALWRVTPMFAWGGTLEVAGFRNEPEDPDYTDARAGAVFLGITGRVYFYEEGRFEPFVELGLGGGALGTRQDEPTATGPTGYEETGAGPAMRGGIGFDFHLSRTLRLGPALSVTHVFVDKIRRCKATGSGQCQDVSTDLGGHLDSYLQVVGNLTFQFGSEL